ncbi:MAG TPA: hypothetical protein K8V35_09570 [Aliicoccus persicus]|uniref:HEAT repeat-containing protein n=1 Tax=Aliicoccus persicus TaxID=930138 RepID=A0A921DYN4_9STAP|nr:hypothetical protein [Aliicoccus persicus]
MELIYILNIVILVLFLIIIVIATTYIRHYNKHTRLKNAINSYKREHFYAWFDYLYKGTEHPPPFKAYHERRATIEIFFAIVRNATTEQIDVRISKFLSENNMSHYHKALKSPHWAVRVDALSEISTFKIDGYIQVYTDKQIEKFSLEETVLYFTYLSIFDKNRFENLLFTTKRLNEFESKMILNQLDDQYLLDLKETFNTMSVDLQKAYLDIIPHVRDESIVRWLETLIIHDNLEIRIRALKGIHKIGYIENERKYLPLFKADEWQLRMFACRIAPLAGEYFLKNLNECLNDEVKLVRLEAKHQLNRLSIYHVVYSY